MADTPLPIVPLGFNTDFQRYLGVFQASWASCDQTVDVAIWKFLKVTPEQAHLITSGMMFGRKARLLCDLVGRSDHPNKSEILGTFNKLRGQNKRDIIIHGHYQYTDKTVTFVERSVSGEFKAIKHTFTLDELRDHVQNVLKWGGAFHKALGYSREDLHEFANAAFNLDRKSNKSPGNPDAMA